MDTMQKAVRVGKIATGETPKPKKTQRHKGGVARAEKMTGDEKKVVAKKGAKARWKKT